MNILIVGGAGYLGGALTDILMHTEHNIRIYDFLLYEDYYRKDIDFVFGDVRAVDKLKNNLDWADTVIWLAALVGDPACSLNEDLTKQINVESVKCLKDNFKGRIIFMSTCSVYGASDGFLSEVSSVNPLSLYAETKLWAEDILKNANALIFRLGTLYGIGDRFSRIRFDLVVNTLVMRAICHGKISVFGGGQYRPLLHVRDAAGLIASVLDNENRGIYNLHSENTTITDFVCRVRKFFPEVKVDETDGLFQDSRNYKVISKKAEEELNFAPKLNIDDGILELKALLENGRIKDSFLRRFSNYLYLRPLFYEYKSPLGKRIGFNL